MNYKPDEKNWMAYLYGELEGEEKEKMDLYLMENAEAKNEFENFRKLRHIMSSVEDKEVIAPPIFIDGSRQQRFLWNAQYFRVIMGIAASLLLVLLVGKLTDTRISFSGNEFRMSFGETEAAKPIEAFKGQPSLTPEQVQQMINASLENSNTAMQANWKESQQKLDASIRQNLAVNSTKIDNLVRNVSSASQQQINQYVATIQTENMRQVKDYFQLTSGEQKKYIEGLLVDFAEYLQQQRANDLQVVQTQLNSLQQNTDVFKQETEQILTSIITNVGTDQTSKEIKN
jgi:hypothetical protein